MPTVSASILSDLRAAAVTCSRAAAAGERERRLALVSEDHQWGLASVLQRNLDLLSVASFSCLGFFFGNSIVGGRFYPIFRGAGVSLPPAGMSHGRSEGARMFLLLPLGL